MECSIQFVVPDLASLSGVQKLYKDLRFVLFQFCFEKGARQ